MKPVPKELLEEIQQVTPPGSEVIPLERAYEDEDHNIAVLVNDGEDPRLIKDRLLDTIMDYDEVHGTFTVCMVWLKEERPAPVSAKVVSCF
jgi:hypothetical protein